MTIIISEMEENTLIDWDIILAFNHSFANRQLNIEELSLDHWSMISSHLTNHD
jgi:hypothetical protein